MFKTNRKDYRVSWVRAIFVFFLCCNMAYCDDANLIGMNHKHEEGESTTGGRLTTSIPFTGVASGGELVLAEALNRSMRTMTIRTQPGESAESVANHMAEYINGNDPFEWGFPIGIKAVTAENSTLKGLLGMRTDYILAGTETGLGIPVSPSSLTCTRDIGTNTLLIDWDNPPKGYDDIAVIYNWTNFDHRGVDIVDGNATTNMVALSERPLNTDDLDVWVVGYRKGVPSGAAAIHVRGKIQEELYGVPFCQGVAPNWIKWSKEARGMVFSQKTRTQKMAGKGKSFNPVESAEAKPFYQVIETDQTGGIGGVSRTFRGLIPGHRYRVTVRFAVENLNASDIISIDASYHSSMKLAIDQMAGISKLPNDSALVLCDANHVQPRGQFISRSTEITLPNGVHNLTVWLRCNVKSSIKVSLDWLRLEDLSI